MAIDENAITATKNLILRAAAENDWSIDMMPPTMNRHQGLIQTRNSDLLRNFEDYQTLMEAWDRLVSEDLYFRHHNGVVYKATPAGRAAFANTINGLTRQTKATKEEISDMNNKNVFVVHGHDEAAKDAVCNSIHAHGATPIVLHEQPNAGQTIIEKLETNAKVGYAVILLTPDDLAYSRKESPTCARPRARQNVILEMGFFIGKLGRGRVCVLHKGDTEILSDFAGVVYVAMDDAGLWKYKLKEELAHAGI